MIEAEGGMQNTDTSGKIHSEIETTWKARKNSLESGETSLIGVNIYANPEEETLSRSSSLPSPDGPFKLQRWSEPFEKSGKKS